MKGALFISQSEPSKDMQKYQISTQKESIKLQSQTQANIERLVLESKQKSCLSETEIKKLDKKEELQDFPFQDYENRSKDEIIVAKEGREISTFINTIDRENRNDQRKYGDNQLSGPRLKQPQEETTYCPPPFTYFQDYFVSTFQYIYERNEEQVEGEDEVQEQYEGQEFLQQQAQSPFVEKIKSRQDYQGIIYSKFKIPYYILFLKKHKLQNQLYSLFKEQLKNGFCTKKKGQDGLKILKGTKNSMYQLRISTESRLVGPLLKYQKEKVNLIVFERCANKNNVDRVIGDLDGIKRISDLKQQIYENITFGKR